MALTEAQTIPVASLNATNIPREHLFEAWRQTASPLFDVLPLKKPSNYNCSVTSYLVGQLVFSQTAFDGMQFVRSPHKLSGSESDCITVQYYAAGQIQGSLDNGTPLLMQRSGISIQDFAHAYKGIGETTRNFGVVIPRHLITNNDEIYNNHPMFSWDLSTPTGRILANALDHLWQELPDLTQAEAPAVAAGFVGLLNGLLTAKRDPHTWQQVQEATLTAMKDYIQDNLQISNLGVELLCRNFHCSRSTVYRLFKPLGGVKGYIRTQRLNVCFQDLRSLGNKHSKAISELSD